MHEVFRLGPDHSLLTLSYFQHCKPLFHKISNFSFYLQCQYHIYFLWYLNVNFDFHFFHLENTWFVENILQKPRYLFLLLVFIFIILIVLICRYFKLSLLNCHSASRADVPTCFACLCANVLCLLTCSRANVHCVLKCSVADVLCVLMCSWEKTGKRYNIYRYQSYTQTFLFWFFILTSFNTTALIILVKIILFRNRKSVKCGQFSWAACVQVGSR